MRADGDTVLDRAERQFRPQVVTVRLGEMRPIDLVVLDEQPSKKRLIQATTHFVAGVDVEIVGIGQQFQRCVHEGRGFFEIVVNPRELLADPGSFGSNVSEPGTDLLLRESPIGGELNQIRFLRVEAGQLLGELVTESALCGLLIRDRLVDGVAHEGDELR